MKRLSLIYGSAAGALIIGSAVLSASLSGTSTHLAEMEWLGYLVMIVALSSIFLGIKRYRDGDLGGVIRFGSAFLMGLGITTVASIIYVAVWELYLLVTDYAFIEAYTSSVLAAMEADGVAAGVLDAEAAKMEAMKEQYANPLFRIPVTFLEIFPVGLLITLISAAVLRNPKVLPAR